jgi:uncharacterized RDD family membrane protein YckC
VQRLCGYHLYKMVTAKGHNEMANPTGTANDMTAAFNDRAFEGVLSRRVFAFLIDYVVMAIVIAVLGAVIGVLGILTFGLAWLLYAVLVPIVVVPYVALSLGGRDQATPGMKAMDLKIIKDDGGQIDWLIATVHLILFWVFNTILTPFILLLALFTSRKRALHDILLNTSMQRASAR